MKRIFIVLAICMAAGCTSKEQQAKEGAQMFLDAFLSNEYDKAALLCTDEIKEDLNRAFADFKNLDSNVRALLVNECAQYKAEIASVTRINGSDTFKVEYKLIKANSDSLSLDSSCIESNLTLTGGKINRMGDY